MDKQLRFLFFQIENSVSSNNQSFIRLLFSYFDLHGVSDETKRQKYPRSGPKWMIYIKIHMYFFIPTNMYSTHIQYKSADITNIEKKVVMKIEAHSL